LWLTHGRDPAGRRVPAGLPPLHLLQQLPVLCLLQVGIVSAWQCCTSFGVNRPGVLRAEVSPQLHRWCRVCTCLYMCAVVLLHNMVHVGCNCILAVCCCLGPAATLVVPCLWECSQTCVPQTHGSVCTCVQNTVCCVVWSPLLSADPLSVDFSSSALSQP
jgi:hypothetical protein